MERAHLGGGGTEICRHGYLLLLKYEDFSLGGGTGGLEGVVALLDHGVALFHKSGGGESGRGEIDMVYSYVYKDRHPALGELANRLTEVTLTVAICTSLINPGGCNIKVYQIYIIQ